MNSVSLLQPGYEPGSKNMQQFISTKMMTVRPGVWFAPRQGPAALCDTVQRRARGRRRTVGTFVPS